MPYPGFPTDMQSVMMAAATVADGTTVFVENIFESRSFLYPDDICPQPRKVPFQVVVAPVDVLQAGDGALALCRQAGTYRRPDQKCLFLFGGGAGGTGDAHHHGDPGGGIGPPADRGEFRRQLLPSQMARQRAAAPVSTSTKKAM